QAEDGIRDRNVTGVQTCALPISPAARPRDEHEITDQLDVGEGSARGGFALDNVCIAPEASSVTMTPTRPTPETVASTKVPATRGIAAVAAPASTIVPAGSSCPYSRAIRLTAERACAGCPRIAEVDPVMTGSPSCDRVTLRSSRATFSPGKGIQGPTTNPDADVLSATTSSKLKAKSRYRLSMISNAGATWEATVGETSRGSCGSRSLPSKKATSGSIRGWINVLRSIRPPSGIAMAVVSAPTMTSET